MANERRAIPRVNVLGVGISVLTLSRATAVIAEAVATKAKGYICVTDAHAVMEAQSNPALRRILNEAFLTTPDGMPMVWMGKLNGHGRDIQRVYGPDLLLAVAEWSQGGRCRHFFLGGGPGVAEELKRRLELRFAGIQVVGCYSPPFRPLNPDEERMLQDTLERLQPDITWIGLSTPKQEQFMARYLPMLNTTLMIGVGAAFDFHAGRVRQAPRWIQRSGFEWLFRVCQEPRRLWRRYLRSHPLFALRLAGQVTGLRRYPLE